MKELPTARDEDQRAGEAVRRALQLVGPSEGGLESGESARVMASGGIGDQSARSAGAVKNDVSRLALEH